MVRQNQVLIRLPDSSKMQVKAKVNESQIRLFSKGLKATIRLDAFPDQELHGQIERVNEYPEPTGWGSGSVKDYAVFIRIENPTADLRPGLTAKVAVLISAEDNVLTVPVDAVKEHGGRFYCLVRPEGEWESREVKIGATNDVFVVIREGLSVGDEVVRAASRYVDRVKLPDLPKKSGKPGSARPGKGSEQRGKRRKATSQRAPRGGH
jgi:multidrug efflux pump subunit AcrA (membrane-fusion protein)